MLSLFPAISFIPNCPKGIKTATAKYSGGGWSGGGVGEAGLNRKMVKTALSQR